MTQTATYHLFVDKQHTFDVFHQLSNVFEPGITFTGVQEDAVLPWSIVMETPYTPTNLQKVLGEMLKTISYSHKFRLYKIIF